MKGYDATEIAYKNGYKKGYEDATKEFVERLKKRNKLYCTGGEDVKEMDFVADQIAKEMEKDQK